MSDCSTEEPGSKRGPLFEWEFWSLLGLAAVLYLARVDQLPIRGEESRWTCMAREMLETGDWVVPRQQGHPFISRPPLSCWLVALGILARGEADLIAIRALSIIATLLSIAVVYLYCRQFLSRTGALAGGIVCAGMGQMLELGRLAESEAAFTLFVSTSLFAWHTGYQRRWPAAATWAAGYALVALGALTKGSQAPVYFLTTIGVFLLLKRDLWYLVRPAHLVGVLACVSVVAVWQVPFFFETGYHGFYKTWIEALVHRMPTTPGRFAEHVVTYPLEILGCMLPWSAFLLLLPRRDLWKSIGPAKPYVSFLLIAFLVTFPSCWFVPQARGRYYMPMYPCVAALLGWIVHQCLCADVTSLPGRFWRRYVDLFTVVMAISVSAAAVCAVWEPEPFEESGNLLFVFGAVTFVLGCVLFVIRRQPQSISAPARLLAITAFLGAAYSGPALHLVIRSSEDMGSAVAAAKQKLPPDTRLVSFGMIQHTFAYYFGEPIERATWPEQPADVDPAIEYFCYYTVQPETERPPIDFETLAVISCHRSKVEKPNEIVVIGRRLNHVARRDPSAAER